MIRKRYIFQGIKRIICLSMSHKIKTIWYFKRQEIFNKRNKERLTTIKVYNNKKDFGNIQYDFDMLHCLTSCLRHWATRREVPGSIPGRDLWNFPSGSFLLSAFNRTGDHSASHRNEYQGTSSGVKCGQRVELTALLS